MFSHAPECIPLAYLCRFAVRSPCSLTTRLFSAVWDQSVCGLAASPSRLGGNGFADLPTNPAYTLGPGIPGTRRYLPFCVPPSLITRTRRYRNVDLFSIDYAFRPRLRYRLTLRRKALRRNPWTSGEQVFHLLYRYSCQHSHFRYLEQTSRPTFNGVRNAPLPRLAAPAASAHDLSPVTSSARADSTSELLRFL